MLKTAQNQVSKGFTLIELLVVIGILSVLAVAALVTINPAEAQRKARDTQRLQDMATIQAVVEQYLNDNPGALSLVTSMTLSSASAGAKGCSAANWLATSMGASAGKLCTYANVIPVDPTNRASANITDGTGAATTGNLYYAIIFNSGGGYKICAHLESKSNAAKLVGDGESLNTTSGSVASKVYSSFSDDTLVCDPGP
jgi:prepilin-type N-terminal cleavage/methylation domain-containing protein